MDVDSIRAYCLSFPDATEKLQWGDALCFKVRAKMFAVLGLDRVRLTLKCTAESFAELIERAGIRPAPYLGHRNWVMLDRLDGLPGEELRGAIRQSYEMRRRLRGRAAGRKRGRRSLLDREAARGRVS
jgi:predicted DNA-binding protein (MmcQ/YjbR family)